MKDVAILELTGLHKHFLPQPVLSISFFLPSSRANEMLINSHSNTRIVLIHLYVNPCVKTLSMQNVK